MKKLFKRACARLLPITLLIALTLLMSSAQSVFAAPPGTAYAPGETISPGCMPGATNCTVRASASTGANSDITSLSALSTALTVAQGGTGLSSISPNKLLYSSATNTISALSFGSEGQVLKMVSGVLSWAADIASTTGSTTTFIAGNGVAIATSSDTATFSVIESALTLANLGGTLSVAKGGTGATTTASARTALGAAASGANSDITSLSALSTPLTAGQGGTGQASYTAGDLLYASNSSTLSKLSAGTNGFVLTMSSGVPTWLVAGAGSSTTYLAGNGVSLATSTNTFSVNESELTLSNIGGTLPVTKGGTGTSTAFTAGAVVFATSSGAFSQNATNFSWDNNNSRLSVVGTVAGTHIKGLGSAPSISAGTGAGTLGLTAPVVSVSGTDSSGEITVTAGNGVLALSASVFTLTFATPYGTSPHVIFSPSNSATALLSGVTNVFASTSASAFNFVSGTAALTALTTYKWTYQVIE